MTEPKDPTTIDWPERQARALIPFEVFKGRPFNRRLKPAQIATVPVRSGRNGLPLWGENPEAAALVTCTHAGRRWVLLVQRSDDGTWVMPGGSIETGERPLHAAARTCREESGFNLTRWGAHQIVEDEPRWVPDSRGSMEAWVVLVPVRFDLGEVESLPEVRGRWVSMLPEVLIFPAHREILAGVR